MPEKDKSRGLRLPSETLDKFDEVCSGMFMSFPQLVHALMVETIQYKEREGMLAMPFRLVSERDFQRFKTWENQHLNSEGEQKAG